MSSLLAPPPHPGPPPFLDELDIAAVTYRSMHDRLKAEDPQIAEQTLADTVEGLTELKMDWREARNTFGYIAYGLVLSTILITVFAAFMAGHSG